MTVTKMIDRVSLFLIVLIPLWITGLFKGLPVIPCMETDYYDSKTNQQLSKGLVLKEGNGIAISLEIPDYFSAGEQCFDTWFTPGRTNTKLIVRAFSLQVFDKNKTEIPRTTAYLFVNDGSQFNGTKQISNFEKIKNDTTYQKMYKFIRTVFNLQNKRAMVIEIKVDYTIDNIFHSQRDTFEIRKKQALAWNELRVH